MRWFGDSDRLCQSDTSGAAVRRILAAGDANQVGWILQSIGQYIVNRELYFRANFKVWTFVCLREGPPAKTTIISSEIDGSPGGNGRFELQNPRIAKIGPDRTYGTAGADF